MAPVRPEPERFGIYDAKGKLSQLVERAAARVELVLTRNGVPVARLVPFEEPSVDAAAVRAVFSELDATAARAAPGRPPRS